MKVQKRNWLLRRGLIVAISAKEEKKAGERNCGKHPVESQISGIQAIGQGKEDHARNGEYSSKHFTTPGNDQPDKAHEEKEKEQHFNRREWKLIWNGANEDIADHDANHQEQHHARKYAGKQLIVFHGPFLSAALALVSRFMDRMARLACTLEKGQMSLLAEAEASLSRLFAVEGARTR